MSAVDRIRGTSVSGTSEVRTSTNRSTATASNYNFQDRIQFNEQELKSNIPDADNITAELAEILQNLMFEVINSGCDLVKRGALRVGNNQGSIEASFQPPTKRGQAPRIYIPMQGGISEIRAINHLIPGAAETGRRLIQENVRLICQNSNNQDLTKLIILLAHEYGHFLSYQRGYHDQELKQGLNLLFDNSPHKNDRLTYSVFSEENTAWRLAEQKLRQYRFCFWTIFEHVKYSSLKSYYQQLKLDHASVDVYCKLSLLGLNLNLLR